jgi:hypothetical protein
MIGKSVFKGLERNVAAEAEQPQIQYGAAPHDNGEPEGVQRQHHRVREDRPRFPHPRADATGFDGFQDTHHRSP